MKTLIRFRRERLLESFSDFMNHCIGAAILRMWRIFYFWKIDVCNLCVIWSPMLHVLGFESATLVACLTFSSMPHHDISWLLTSNPDESLSSLCSCLSPAHLRLPSLHPGGASTHWTSGKPAVELPDRSPRRDGERFNEAGAAPHQKGAGDFLEPSCKSSFHLDWAQGDQGQVRQEHQQLLWAQPGLWGVEIWKAYSRRRWYFGLRGMIQEASCPVELSSGMWTLWSMPRKTRQCFARSQGLS